MKVSASLWSTDLLDVGAAMARVEHVVDGFHVDVMDGHFAPGLVFGPDFVRAVAARTRRLVDVHLMVDDAERWIGAFVDAGAGMLTIHPQSCADVAATLARIGALRVRPAVAVNAGDALAPIHELLERVDRVLLMGTRVGIKGVEIEPATYNRVASMVRARECSARRPDVFVDGGIRRHTVPLLAQAGADGVTPGSLVFGAPDPAAAVTWISGQG